MIDTKATVAQNLAALRKARGLTQAELAERFNYSDKAVCRWERGDTLPDINVLAALCEFYGITMNDLTSPDLEPEENEASEKNTVAYRIWLCALSATVVWLCATIWFVTSMTVWGNPYWVVFIWAVPLSCLVVMKIGKKIMGWIIRFIFSSLFCWSLITASYLHLLVELSANVWLIFIVGLPLQAVLFLWQRLRRLQGKR